MTTESLIQNQIRVGLSKAGHTVFRINVGKVKMQNGRWFETGVPKGYCDLSGFRKGDAKAFFIEVKNETGRVRPEQKKFMEVMASRGALVGVARSVDDALKIVNGEVVTSMPHARFFTDNKEEFQLTKREVASYDPRYLEFLEEVE